MLFTSCIVPLILYGCGYHMVGSSSIPFDTIVVLPVQNKTQEPLLEDVMHRALSSGFISQGIRVTSTGDRDRRARLETVIRSFSVNTVAASDDKVKEQSVVMEVDFRLIEGERVMEFTSVKSPIAITFQATGSVTEAVIEKQRAIERAAEEIAKELVSRIALRYAE